MNEPSLTVLHDSWDLSAKEVLTPLLHPGETLKIAISGATAWFEGVSLVDLVMALFEALGGVATSQLNRTTYIGITDKDLVFAISQDPKKPSRLQRVYLGNVSLIKFKENRTPFLIDVLVINAGKKRLTLSTGYSLRPVIHEFATILNEQRQEAHLTSSTEDLQGAPAQQEPPLPFNIRFVRPLASALHDIATTIRADGPAQASIRASRYSHTLFWVSIGASFLAILGIVVLGSIFPTGLWEQLRDVLIFILLLPSLFATFLSVSAALVATGLAIYSIFKIGERARTVLTAFLSVATLLILYVVAAFGALLLGGE